MRVGDYTERSKKELEQLKEDRSITLTAIAFFAAINQIPAFTNYVSTIAGGQNAVLSLLNPRTFAGLLIGSAMPPFFTALSFSL